MGNVKLMCISIRAVLLRYLVINGIIQVSRKWNFNIHLYRENFVLKTNLFL